MVIISPADVGSIPSSSLIKGRTGVIIEPAITVKVAADKMLIKANLGFSIVKATLLI